MVDADDVQQPLRRGSGLTVAHDELLERYRCADAAADWREREILGGLADVADYLRRIGDHGDSAHYRADKAGPLLHAACRVGRDCLLAYAGWPDDSDDGREILDLAELLDEVVAELWAGLWRAARHARGGDGAEYDSAAAELRSAARRFSEWADAQCSSAVPDPIDE